MSMPTSRPSEKEASFRIKIANIPVMMGDIPNTTDIQPDGIYWAAQ
jgi:hypothetical protein